MPDEPIDRHTFHDYIGIMESTVTTKNMISIPVSISRALGIRPGWKLDWALSERSDELLVKVIPDRTEQARRLFGQGQKQGIRSDVVAELIREREEEESR
jgi:bifunctional DNA-binding transcriptional regulator/antitoxin component of YhaV-PrlF toxin-antitoxin module